jgi:hypothetical protein
MRAIALQSPDIGAFELAAAASVHAHQLPLTGAGA